MEWFHVYVIVYLVIAAIGVFFSESCFGFICSALLMAGLIWALNAGGFFA